MKPAMTRMVGGPVVNGGGGMATFKIELSESEARQIEELANEMRLAPEELLRRGIAEWLTRPRDDFAEAAAYVLEKNAELYKRLS